MEALTSTWVSEVIESYARMRRSSTERQRRRRRKLGVSNVTSRYVTLRHVTSRDITSFCTTNADLTPVIQNFGYTVSGNATQASENETLMGRNVGVSNVTGQCHVTAAPPLPSPLSSPPLTPLSLTPPNAPHQSGEISDASLTPAELTPQVGRRENPAGARHKTFGPVTPAVEDTPPVAAVRPTDGSGMPGHRNPASVEQIAPEGNLAPLEAKAKKKYSFGEAFPSGEREWIALRTRFPEIPDGDFPRIMAECGTKYDQINDPGPFHQARKFARAFLANEVQKQKRRDTENGKKNRPTGFIAAQPGKYDGRITTPAGELGEIVGAWSYGERQKNNER